MNRAIDLTFCLIFKMEITRGFSRQHKASEITCPRMISMQLSTM